jgi:pyrroline-5-carboxylate reductase
MGTALIKGWLANKLAPIVAVEPKPSPELKKLSKGRGLTLVSTLDKIGKASPRACVVAIKPQILKTEASTLRAIAQDGAVMISIAAGTRTKTLEAAWGGNARIVRAMPNTPGAIGRGITGLFATAGTNARDRKLADTLLAALGKTVWVKSEALIDAVTAVSGSGPAYVFHLVEALTEAGVKAGLDAKLAGQLARATVAGAGALLDADKSDAADLRRAVTSPGGTTEAALKILMAELPDVMTRAVAAAKKRAEELG